jgi:Tol biopolymer transport system component
MKLFKVLSLILCTLVLVPQLALGQEAHANARFRKHDGAIHDNYIVVFNESVPPARVSALAAQLAQAHRGTVGFTYESALRGFSVQMSEAQAMALSHNPHVAFVEQDVLVEGAATQPAAPWGLDRIDQRTLPLDTTYTYLNSGTGANVYVIDGGIRLTHQEFGGRALFAYDNVADGRNGVDCNGHGTSVAAIIGGATYGVAKNAKLHAVRVLNCLNQGTAARIIAGVDWVTANHVKPAVANLSFATGLGNDAMDLAVRNSIAAGITYAVAAGNNAGDAALRSPARVTEAITVAAIDQNDNQATFSNFGAAVDVYAPGVEIVTASSFDDVSTIIRSGTSFAAPFIAGSAARYLSANPGESPASVSLALTSNATAGKVPNAGEGTPNLVVFKPNSKIAFYSQRDGNWEVYLTNFDGSVQTNLSLSTASDQSPVWSPDGRKLAFTSKRTGGGDIYVINSDGSGLLRLTTSTYADLEPTWSPDSQRLAFISKRDGNSDVFVMNADGTNQVNLTRNTVQESAPVWSPTENKIAYLSIRSGLTKIFIMNADGTNQFQLTGSAVNEANIDWSPDGQKLAFDSYHYTPDYVEHYDLWVVNADGSALKNLTPYNAAADTEPDWSPDGKTLIIASTRYAGSQYGAQEIYTINPDGTNAVRHTNARGNFAPKWAPGGDRFVYMRDSSTNYTYDFYALNTDGSNWLRLTTNTAQDYDPVWQPM